MTQHPTQPGGEVELFVAPDGQIRLDVRLERETVWLSLNQMAELFGRDKSVISRHLRNIFDAGELDRDATVAKTATVQKEGGREVVREIEHFDLDAILSVGYRVNSKRGTQFRIWATRVLREHLVQGYTFNQTRLAERGLLEARQMLRDGERSEVATIEDYLIVRQQGGLGKACLRGAKRGWQVHQLFGDKLNSIIEELNGMLAA